MLAITLDQHQHINTYKSSQADDWRFEAKVVKDGLFAEVRVCFLPSVKKKNNLKNLDLGENRNESNLDR
jgi:hypothetical protein